MTLPHRYLWVVGLDEGMFKVGDLLGDRYLFCGPKVVLDTRPGIPLKPEVELPEALLPYLKLFPYRLHISQIYTLLAPPAPHQPPILLLEQAPLSTTDLRNVPHPLEFTSQPLFEAWSHTPPLRQVHWLWQLAQLWQPLHSQGVGCQSSAAPSDPSRGTPGSSPGTRTRLRDNTDLCRCWAFVARASPPYPRDPRPSLDPTL